MLTADMFAPVIKAVTDNIGIAITAGMGVFGLIAAIKAGINMFKSLIQG